MERDPARDHDGAGPRDAPDDPGQRADPNHPRSARAETDLSHHPDGHVHARRVCPSLRQPALSLDLRGQRRAPFRLRNVPRVLSREWHCGHARAGWHGPDVRRAQPGRFRGHLRGAGGLSRPFSSKPGVRDLSLLLRHLHTRRRCHRAVGRRPVRQLGLRHDVCADGGRGGIRRAHRRLR